MAQTRTEAAPSERYPFGSAADGAANAQPGVAPQPKVAPELSRVSPLVRDTHETWDGAAGVVATLMPGMGEEEAGAALFRAAARKWFAREAARAAARAAKAVESIGPKIAKQMGPRGWTREAVEEAIKTGEQIKAINKATGNPATRYVHPGTGQSVVVDDVTNEIIHVGGQGFSYGPGSGDLP